MEWKLLLLLPGLSFTTISTLAQTGPGGVGGPSINVLWLKADAGTSSAVNGAAISAWNDQSGNAIHVTQPNAVQQPLFQTNIMNGYPAIQFDNVSVAGQNDKLTAPDSPLLDNTTGYSFFTVSRPQNFGNANAIVSKRTTVSVEHSFMLFFWTGERFNTDIQTMNDRFASTNSFAPNANYLLDVVYDGTLPAASRSKFYIGESLNRVATETSSIVPDNNSPLLIGSTDANDERAFGGYISEVIIYRQALNKASRIIVNNYLSAKYDIALTANDKYAGDLPANGNYDRDVAGIGTDTIQPGAIAGSNPSFAASASAGFGLTAVSGFDAGDYVLAGHALAANAAITTDIAGLAGTFPCRWQRIWYVDVTNTGTPIVTNIEFDLSDGGMTPNMFSAAATSYVLLYRSGQAGAWSELATASGISGDKILFNNYALSLDGYYTIGSRNCAASPLPVELVAFTAEPSGRDVLLKWQTESELNNDHFTLETSRDGVYFEPVAMVPGAGTTTLPQYYEHTDANPGGGIHYYRLRQTDTDGTTSETGVISVMLDGDRSERFTVFPNPNNGTFSVLYAGMDETPVEVTVLDASGRAVYTRTQTAAELRSDGIRLDAPAAGYYEAVFSVYGSITRVRVLVQ